MILTGAYFFQTLWGRWWMKGDVGQGAFLRYRFLNLIAFRTSGDTWEAILLYTEDRETLTSCWPLVSMPHEEVGAHLKGRSLWFWWNASKRLLLSNIVPLLCFAGTAALLFEMLQNWQTLKIKDSESSTSWFYMIFWHIMYIVRSVVTSCFWKAIY